MKNLTIVGAQWGDEGKGKIVDYLCSKFDVVLRFQGGHNAGHTIIIGREKFILSILPSGLIRNKLSIIGSSVVIDPVHFLKEIDLLRKKRIKISKKNLKIANNASILLPFHSIIDQIREQKLLKKKIGTTGKGIGPCYEDKVARRGLKIYDLEDIDILKVRLKNLVNFHNIFLKSLSKKRISFNETFKLLKSIRKKILPFSVDVSEFLNSKYFLKKKFLFEGAQGLMLDIDHGTFPFVTSSNTIPAIAAVSIGIKPSKIGHILGVVKAYTTRVGEGPFPTEIKTNIGLKLAKNGHEFGSVTGRPRRCGWLDLKALETIVFINSVTNLCITKLDVLDGFEEIQVCIDYDQNQQPIYKTFSGWKQDTSNARSFNDLPKAAQDYILFIEETLDCPVGIVSVGPSRDQTIYRD